MEELLKELVKKLLVDNLEIRLSPAYERHGIKVELLLFDEVISSDFISI